MNTLNNARPPSDIKYNINNSIIYIIDLNGVGLPLAFNNSIVKGKKI